jgi:acetate kinase
VRVLVVNAGSSSLKLSVVDENGETAATAELPAPGESIDEAAVAGFLAGEEPIEGVGHRVVHGGTRFVEPVVVDDEVRRRLEGLRDLAPLHLPKSLLGLDLLCRLLPSAPAVACFDTAFFAGLPAAASTYALPAAWRRRWDLRRFGFHGLSHAYATRRTAELLGRDPSELCLVTCHLGAGASLAAVQEGRPVDTTMGFTPLEGLVMATRSGSVDPGLLLWLEEHVGLPPAELAATLEHRSGLLGLAGTADLRQVLERAGGGDPEASLAVEVYLHRLRAAIAAMAAAMGGLDALAFTGGVGEHAPSIRARALDGLGFLGLSVDAGSNEEGEGDREIGGPGAPVRVVRVASREDLEIARQVHQVLGPGPG